MQDLLPNAALALFSSPIHLPISVELSAASLDILYISRRKDDVKMKGVTPFVIYDEELCGNIADGTI